MAYSIVSGEQVAETVGPAPEIVGVVRGCVKTVATTTSVETLAVYAKVGYILGLRVSPYHRYAYQNGYTK